MDPYFILYLAKRQVFTAPMATFNLPIFWPVSFHVPEQKLLFIQDSA
jgi:hypothetical protein